MKKYLKILNFSIAKELCPTNEENNNNTNNNYNDLFRGSYKDNKDIIQDISYKCVAKDENMKKMSSPFEFILPSEKIKILSVISKNMNINAN